MKRMQALLLLGGVLGFFDGLVWVSSGLSLRGQQDSSAAARTSAEPLDFSAHGGDWNQGTCSDRKRQSPINFDALYMAPNERAFGYFYNDLHSQDLVLQNDGVSIFVDTIGQGFGGVTLPVREKPWYNLKRIEFHAMSEHTFRGKHAPLEMHLIHQTSVISDPTFGPDLVIVAIPFKAPDVAIPEATHPASNKPLGLATPTKTNKAAALLQGRKRSHGPALFVDGVEPAFGEDGLESPVLEEEEYEAQQAGTDVDRTERAREANAEIDMVHSLADNAANTTHSLVGSQRRNALGYRYKVPSAMEKGANPTLQHFVEKEPPVIDKKSENPLSPAKPLNLGDLVSEGTFFSYSGSEVAPPCAERVWWYVRRDFPTASTSQVQALVDSLYKMSDKRGNYRTVMPLNSRPVKIVKAEVQEPATRPFTLAPPVGPPWGMDDGRESRYEDYAKDAITIAKASSDYAKDIDYRLRHASQVHAQVMMANASTAGTPAPQTVPPPPLDQVWAANEIAKRIAAGVKVAVTDATRQIKPLAEDLARSYLRQDLLAKQGYTTPPPPPAV